MEQEHHDRLDAKKNIPWIILTVVVLIGISMFRSTNTVELSFQNEIFTITGPQNFAYSAAYQDIQSLAIAYEIDRGEMISGSTANKISAGKWQSDTYGEYDLCISAQISAYIILRSMDGDTLIFNYESQETTEQIYANFMEMLIEDGYLPQ